MDTNRFDQIASTVGQTQTRRSAFRFLAAAALGAGSLTLLGHEESQARKKGKGKGKGKGTSTNTGTGTGTGTIPTGSTTSTPLALRQICTPGASTCSAGLACDAPTTRHTCSSTVAGVGAWCCLPAGSICRTECDCCGNTYCAYDDANVGHCVVNPEGK